MYLKEFQLLPNYPNPFNASTKITFVLPKIAEIELTVIDMLGRRVRLLEKRTLPAGTYSTVWNGTDNRGSPVSSGVYFFRMQAGKQAFTRKALLLK